MAGYSITQFVSVMILYDIYSNLSDFQFVYIDLFLITTMAALFGFNRAYTGPLAPTPPISALFSVLPVFSLLSQLAIAIGVQVRNPKVNLYFTLDRLRSFSTPRVSPGLCHSTTRMPAIRTLHWKELSTTPASSSKIQILILLLCCRKYFTVNLRYWGGDVCTEEEDPVASLENFAIFAVSQFQYIILVIVFSKGSPYREPIFKNRPLLVSLKLMMLCQSLQCDSVAGGHGHPWCLFPLLDLEARGLAGASVSVSSSIHLSNFLPLFVRSFSFAETFRPAATTSCCFLLLKTLATGSF